jgi:hypothetical protein
LVQGASLEEEQRCGNGGMSKKKTATAAKKKATKKAVVQSGSRKRKSLTRGEKERVTELFEWYPDRASIPGEDEGMPHQIPSPSQIALIASQIDRSGNSPHQLATAAMELWDAANDIVQMEVLNRWETKLRQMLAEFRDANGRVPFNIGMFFLRPVGKEEANVGMLRRFFIEGFGYQSERQANAAIKTLTSDGFGCDELAKMVLEVRTWRMEADVEARRSRSANLLKTAKALGKRGSA